MNKLEIFDEIVRRMKNDAAFCKDYPGADAALYRSKITENMTDLQFQFIVQEYLSTFMQTGHLSFWLMPIHKIPFNVQRYDNKLYVTDSKDGYPLQPGDIITHVDGLSIKECGEQNETLLQAEIEERQGMYWRMHVLPRAKSITYIKKGEAIPHEMDIELVIQGDESVKYICKDMGNDTIYIYLPDFADEETIQKMYTDNEAILSKCKYLIIDVRNNSGGFNTAFYPLLKYCLNNGETIGRYLANDKGCLSMGAEILYSENNCKERISFLEEFLQQELPQETKDIIYQMIDNYKNNSGKGFLKMDEDEEEDLSYVGDSMVEKAIILTNERCGSSGDAFVYMFSLLDKVTVLGRPTMGIQDYTEINSVKFGDFTLNYPTCRLCAIDSGQGMMRKGVPVDQYYPWTPEHITKDVILEEALKLCK